MTPEELNRTRHFSSKTPYHARQVQTGSFALSKFIFSKFPPSVSVPIPQNNKSQPRTKASQTLAVIFSCICDDGPLPSTCFQFPLRIPSSFLLLPTCPCLFSAGTAAWCIENVSASSRCASPDILSSAPVQSAPGGIAKKLRSLETFKDLLTTPAQPSHEYKRFEHAALRPRVGGGQGWSPMQRDTKRSFAYMPPYRTSFHQHPATTGDQHL